jgi:hypothetical protein
LANASPGGKTGKASNKEFFCEGSVSTGFGGLLPMLLKGLARRRLPPREVPDSFNIALRVSFIFKRYVRNWNIKTNSLVRFLKE